MTIAIVTLFVSLVLASGAVGLFIWAIRRGEADYSDQLALMPLADDAGSPVIVDSELSLGAATAAPNPSSSLSQSSKD